MHNRAKMRSTPSSSVSQLPRNSIIGDSGIVSSPSKAEKTLLNASAPITLTASVGQEYLPGRPAQCLRHPTGDSRAAARGTPPVAA